jgi:hypothetical protein
MNLIHNPARVAKLRFLISTNYTAVNRINADIGKWKVEDGDGALAAKIQAVSDLIGEIDMMKCELTDYHR